MSERAAISVRNRSLRWWAPRVVLAAIASFALIQLVPYGRTHANPPVASQPRWDSARTKQLFAQACGACHSNLTTWPWYSDVAPVSWLVQHDVDDGRGRFNVSEWRQQPQPSAERVAEAVRSGRMPPLQYKLIHSDARLTSAQRAQLAAGLLRTFQSSPPPLIAVRHDG